MEPLATPRLKLRPLTQGDAPQVALYANDMRVAHTTRLPHPYTLADGQNWIAKHHGWHQEGSQFVWGIFEGDGPEALRGVMGLVVDRPHRNAELGYWFGVPHWGKGFATEAARAVVKWGFEDLDILRIHATHLAINPASGRVLEKCGFRREGLQRQHLIRFGVVHDLVLYGLLEEEWDGFEKDGFFHNSGK